MIDAAGGEIPSSVTGRSLVPLVRGESDTWRDALHLEYASGATSELALGASPNEPPPAEQQWARGWHALVSDEHKYIWESQTGQELFFDVRNDPFEERDLSSQTDLGPWRQRLIEQLRDRPEGFTDGSSLITGRPHQHMVPGLAPPNYNPGPPVY